MTFAGVSAFALIWAAAAPWISPPFFVWISPVLPGITLAIPFSIFTAGTRSGRKRGFFATREELHPPTVLSHLKRNLGTAHVRPAPLPQLARNYGMMQSILDPYVNALHVSLLRHRLRVTPESREYLDGLRRRLVREGPDALNKRELSALMYDPDVMLRLHYDLWSASGGGLAPWWDTAIRQYNILTQHPHRGARHRALPVRIAETPGRGLFSVYRKGCMPIFPGQMLRHAG